MSNCMPAPSIEESQILKQDQPPDDFGIMRLVISENLLAEICYCLNTFAV